MIVHQDRLRYAPALNIRELIGMKVLVIDSNEPAARFVKGQLEQGGHTAVIECNKVQAVEIARADTFQAVFLDPAPQLSPQKIIAALLNAMPVKPYIAILSESMTYEHAVQGGANDLLRKPLEREALLEIADNADRFSSFQYKLGIPSPVLTGDGGEIIGRDSFAQIFRSALERAKRYNTRPYMLLVAISNHDAMTRDGGAQSAAAAVEKLRLLLLRQYRLSEIIAHTDTAEYAIFLENVERADKALAAAERFAKSFFNSKSDLNVSPSISEIKLELIELPTAKICASYRL